MPSPYQDYANEVAQNYGIDPNVFSALIKQESGWNPNAVSSKGAIGLGQLMPGTASDLGVNPYDWKQNLQGAAKYLKQQLDRFGGRYDLALSAYNSGPGGSEAQGSVENFPETQNYVNSILGSLGDASLDALFKVLPGASALPLDGSDTIKGGTATISNGVSSVVDFLVNFFSKDTLVRTVAIIVGLILLAVAVVSFVKQQLPTKTVLQMASKVAAVAA